MLNGKRPFIINLQLFAEAGAEGAGAGAGEAGAGAEGAGAEGGASKAGAGAGEKTFEDILKDKKYQSEFDKKISKAIETAKSKWELEFNQKLATEKTEAEKMAKMNAEQKAKYEQEKRIAELEAREKGITARELKATALETLAEKELPRELADILNYEDAEKCKASVEAVEKAFQSAVAKAVNNKLRQPNTPKTGAGAGADSGFKFNFTPVVKGATK